jgi:hypothetical protein
MNLINISGTEELKKRIKHQIFTGKLFSILEYFAGFFAFLVLIMFFFTHKYDNLLIALFINILMYYVMFVFFRAFLFALYRTNKLKFFENLLYNIFYKNHYEDIERLYAYVKNKNRVVYNFSKNSFYVFDNQGRIIERIYF